MMRIGLCIATLALAGCSLQTFERTPCLQDADCVSAFGDGSTCVDGGFCEVPTGTLPTIDDTAPTNLLTGQFGSIFLAEVLPNLVFNPEESMFIGLASTVADDGGVQNLAQCVLGSFGVCVDAYPEVGQFVKPDPDLSFFDSPQVRNPGDILAAGTKLIYSPANRFNQGMPRQIAPPGNLLIGGELEPFQSDDAFDVVSALDILMPDPASPIVVAADGDMIFSWKPTGSGRMYLELDGTIVGLDESAGTATVTPTSLGLDGNSVSTTAILSRIASTDVDASGNTYRVQTRRDQPYQVDYLDIEGATPMADGIHLAGSCKEALGLSPVAPGSYYGTVQPYANDVSLLEGNKITYFDSAGRDGFVRIDLTAKQTLLVSYTQVFSDASVYLLDACDKKPLPVAGSDYTTNGDPESFLYVAPFDQTVLLVLDAYVSRFYKKQGRVPQFEGDTFTLDITIK
ncbi:MAG: hypothetical protein KTR31_41470 [Myxococcales bacterium]|nr:hypothetical protein [Myxococcales bacterium]